EAVARGVVGDAFERGGGDVDHVDRGSARGGGLKAEAAVGAEHVEHAAAGDEAADGLAVQPVVDEEARLGPVQHVDKEADAVLFDLDGPVVGAPHDAPGFGQVRSEEHTSELQSRENLVCRLLLEKKKKMMQL